MNKNKDLVICVYDDKAPKISEIILEAFEKYLKANVQKRIKNI